MIGDGGESADEFVQRGERVEVLREAISRLPPDRQELLVLKSSTDLSNREIGAVMGRSEGAIKALYHRTLAALRKDLQGRGF